MSRSRFVLTITLLAATGGLAFMSTREPVAMEPVAFENATLRLRVDLSERQLYVEENGDVVKTYAVAVGTSKHPTPRGSFAIDHVIWNPRWVPPKTEWARGRKPTAPGDPNNPMGKVKAFFRQPDYYLHGTSNEASIGTAASHGCVRLRNDDIVELSRMLVEHGGGPVTPNVIQRLLNRVREERKARLSNPVPLRVQA